MIYAEIVRQETPTEKWIRNVAKNLSWSRNTLSEMRVTKLENSSTVQPEGKQLRKENEESWKRVRTCIMNNVISQFHMAQKKVNPKQTKLNEFCHPC